LRKDFLQGIPNSLSLLNWRHFVIRVLKYLSWGIIILVLLLSAFVAASFYLGSESAGVKSDAAPEIVAPTGSRAALSGDSTPKVSTPEVSTPDISTPDVATPDVATPDVATPEVHTELK
jgi:hypothetical protein